MVEQEAVNFEVAGSSPASRAKLRTDSFNGSVFSLFLARRTRTGTFAQAKAVVEAKARAGVYSEHACSGKGL